MDTKTLIDNNIFENENELKRWLDHRLGQGQRGEKGGRKEDDFGDNIVEKKHIPIMKDIIMAIDESGYRTFKLKHLRGHVFSHDKRNDLLEEYSNTYIWKYLKKLIKCKAVKKRCPLHRTRATIYERNFETIDEAVGMIYEYIK